MTFPVRSTKKLVRNETDKSITERFLTDVNGPRAVLLVSAGDDIALVRDAVIEVR